MLQGVGLCRYHSGLWLFETDDREDGADMAACDGICVFLLQEGLDFPSICGIFLVA